MTEIRTVDLTNIHDITKLPKWAQEKIRRLTERVDSLTTQLAEERGELEVTPITLDPYQSPRYLLDRTIVFQTDHGRISVDFEGSHISIRANDGKLSIQPIVSNVVQARVVPVVPDAEALGTTIFRGTDEEWEELLSDD